MKTLRNASDKDELLRRLGTLQQNTQRKWGKMTAHQMVCHVSDGFLVYMGEIKPDPAPGLLPGFVLKWVALWAPIPWPHGFRTVPELDQQAKETPPVEFQKDTEKLRALIEQFAREEKDSRWASSHPHFGAMTITEWLRLAYLHTDHHLRQFGC